MAEAKQTILLQLELNADQLIKNLIAGKDRAKELKAELELAKAGLLQMQVAGDAGAASLANQQKIIVQYEAELKNQNNEIRTNQRLLSLSASINEENESSLKSQQALLSILTAEYNKLSQEQRENSDEGKKLGAQILAITDSLKSNESALGNNRRNVGNYADAVKQAATQLGLSKDKVNDLKLQINQLTESFKKGQTDEESYNAQLKELNESLGISTQTTEQLGQKLDSLKNIIEQSGENFKSLRQRIREAKDEATLLQDKFEQGLIDEKTLIAAQQRVADLSEEMGDFQKRVDALNPEAKFKAFTQVASGLAGGIGVVSGAMGLLGSESEDAAQALLKVQQFMQFTQGLNQLAELGDSLKNLRIVLGLTTAAQRAQTAAQVQTNTATATGTVVTQGMGAAQTVTTTATKGLTVAMNGLLGPIGLIAIAAALLLSSFDAFGDDTQENVEKLTEKTKKQNDELKRQLDLIKQRGQQQLAEQELALARAEAEGESAEKIIEIENNIALIKRTTLQEETDNVEQQLKNADAVLKKNQELFNQLDAEDKKQKEKSGKGAAFSFFEGPSDKEVKEATDKLKEAQDEVDRLTDTYNSNQLIKKAELDKEELAREAKHQLDLRKISDDTFKARLQLIVDGRQREVQTEIQSNAEKNRQLREQDIKNATDSAQLIEANNAVSKQRIKEINLKFDLQEQEERNQLAVNATKEGTLQRIAAEQQAAQAIRDIRVQDETLTTNQILIVEQELSNKLRDLESSRLAVVESNNQRQVELSRRRAQAELDIRASDVGGDSNAQFLLTLNQINFETQAKLEAKEQEADALKAAAQAEITDREELAARIILIDQTIAEEKLAILRQSGVDTRTEIQNQEQQNRDLIVELRQLALDAANPEDEFIKRRQLLEAQQAAEVNAAFNSIQNEEAKQQAIDEINRRYAKMKQRIIDEQQAYELNAVSQTLGIAAGLFKKDTAAHKILATSQALINTYLAATQAYLVGLQAGYPVGLVLGPVMAAVAVAAGLGNVAQINSVQFYEGGYTEKGNPKDVSRTHTNVHRTVHKEEYVVDHSTLNDPIVGSLVSNVIEKKRLNRSLSTKDLLSLSFDGFQLPIRKYGSLSFATGGYVPPSIVYNNTNQPTTLDTQPIADIIANMPVAVPVLVVPDVTQVQGTINKVETRANI